MAELDRGCVAVLLSANQRRARFRMTLVELRRAVIEPLLVDHDLAHCCCKLNAVSDMEVMVLYGG